MAFKAYFWNFSKKGNSTARPADGDALALDFLAVDQTGIISPSIRVEHANPTEYNYCRIPDFGRYYYVREWVWDSGTWVASLTVDALASFKTYIGNSDIYVLRSSKEQDGDYSDNMYPIGNNAMREANAKDTLWASNFNNGWFVIGVVGSGMTSTGVSYYVLTPTQFKSLNSYLFSNIDWMGISVDEISNALSKALINPYQYMVSCKWFPVEPPTSTTENELGFGWWTIPVSGKAINANSYRTYSMKFELSKHPRSASRGMYLNAAPYTEMRIEIPPFGMVDLNPTQFADQDYLLAQVTVDFISGEGALRVYAGETGGPGAVCSVFMLANLAIDIPVTQLTNNIGGAITSLGNAAGSLANYNVLGTAAGIGDAVTGFVMPTVQTKGSMAGNLSVLSRDWKLHTTHWPVPEDDNDHRGRPLFKNRYPKNLGGYILGADGDISAPATSSELEMIKTSIETGFFYE